MIKLNLELCFKAVVPVTLDQRFPTGDARTTLGVTKGCENVGLDVS